MFTGIVENVGEIAEVKPTPAGLRLRLVTPLASDLTPGESIAVNGVCLTVVSSDANAIHMDVSPETLRVTAFASLKRGALVNLERPMRVDGRVGGHFVQGHVDAMGRLEAIRPEADFHWITVSFPSHLAPYLIHKGSIAVDGISLTVATLRAETFDVQIVPFTMEHTNLSRAQARDRVNLECDMVAKYVVRAAELAGFNFNAAPRGEVTH